MKRFLICVMTVALLVSASVAAVSAADYETDETVWDNLVLKALYIHCMDEIYSDVADDLYEFWWMEDSPIDGVYSKPAYGNMRGFAMSPNGDYAYLGVLNGGDGLRGVSVMDTGTGIITDFYYHHDVYTGGVPEAEHGPFSYAKGIDADTRGYVYVGFSFSWNYNVAHLGIAEQKNDGTLTEVACIPVCEFGPHGDQSGTKVGINGVDVVTVDEKTYCYVVTNYEHDALYCFDVTDPQNPVLNEEFGEGGMIDFTASDCPVTVNGKTVSDPQYLDVEDDGTIWLSMDFTDGNGVMKIEADGSSCTNLIQVDGASAYSVSCYGNFLLLGDKSGGHVYVVDKSSGDLVKDISFVAYGHRVTRTVIRNDILYVCDGGENETLDNTIWVTALSDDGRDYLQNVIKSLNGEFETEEPDESADPADGTDTPADTDAPSDDTDASDVPADDTVAGTDAGTADGTTADTAANTDADTGADTDAGTDATTDASDSGDGCASAVIAGGSVVLLLAAAFAMMKKD